MPPEVFAKYTEDQLFGAMLDLFHAQLKGNQLRVDTTWEQLIDGFRKLHQEQWTEEVRRHFELLKQHSPYVEHFPDYRKLTASVWRFVARNYAYPALTGSRDQHRITSLTLTALGQQVCGQDPSSPSRPGYLERLRAANPRIDDEVFERLIDAGQCLDAGLHRPAIVMIGIAAEVTTVHTFRAMHTLGHIRSGKHVEFKAQLEAIQSQLSNLGLDPEPKHRVGMALGVIEQIRTLRNDAAHHGNPAPDPYVAQSQLDAAAYHLPVLWTELIVPNLAPE